jgi:UDP-glucose 4-epimerase
MTTGVDLVTGGAGFIGSELVRQLVAAQRHVVVLDDLSTGKRDNLTGVDVELVVGSILDPDVLGPLVRRADRIFHLACLGLRRSIHDPEGGHAVNATGTLAVLEAARRSNIARMVHVSSSEVYGSATRAPMDEGHPTQPTTPYGAAKLAGEANARAFAQTYGVPVVIVRPFNGYGPRSHHEGDSGEVIPRFLLRAATAHPLVVFGDGRQTRDFTHVSDLARGMCLAGQAEGVLGETFNLGSGRETSINDLAALVCKLANSSSSVIHEAARPGDVRRHCADARKARDRLGWEQRITLAEGLRLSYDGLIATGRCDELLSEEILHNWERA